MSLRHYPRCRRFLGSQFPSCAGGNLRNQMKRCIPLVALFSICVQGSDVINVPDLVGRATTAMQADWAAAPGFAFVQRDLTTSKGRATRKTHHVFMISGSDYYM